MKLWESMFTKNLTFTKIYPTKISEISNSRKYIPQNFAKCCIRENKSIKFCRMFDLAKICAAKISTIKVPLFSLKILSFWVNYLTSWPFSKVVKYIIFALSYAVSDVLLMVNESCTILIKLWK